MKNTLSNEIPMISIKITRFVHDTDDVSIQTEPKPKWETNKMRIEFKMGIKSITEGEKESERAR